MKGNDYYADKHWTVYALSDPKSGMVRYVGITSNIKARISQHIADARKARTWKDKWIMKLRRSGLRPIVSELEKGFGIRAAQCEIGWISHYRKIGARLVNVTDGGDGARGYKMTPLHRERLRLANTGRKMPRESVERGAAARTGIKCGPEKLADMSRRMKLYTQTDKWSKQLAVLTEKAKKPVVCVETDQRFGSMIEVARMLKVDPIEFNASVRKRKPVCRMRFVSESDVSSGKEISFRPLVPNYFIECVDTGRVFKSTMAASVGIGVDGTSVWKAIKRSGRVRGMEFKKIPVIYGYCLLSERPIDVNQEA